MAERDNTSVWKVPFEVKDEMILHLPEGAEPLWVAVQHGRPCMWIKVRTTAPLVPRRFYVSGTGHHVEPYWRYIGSFMLSDGAFVGHLWEPTLSMAQ